jgi:16S rRNA (adenine1518-N6/adenine1519-N6)-dimethyltransferase
MNIRANKKLGQNFLKSQKALDKIVQLAQIKKDDLVLEIGPGTGILTKPLIDNGAQVIAIEKDPRMEQILLEKISSHNLQIVIGDIREYYSIFLKNNQEDFKIIANIPYYLSSFLIRMIFNESRKPGIIVLMVQKE